MITNLFIFYENKISEFDMLCFKVDRVAVETPKKQNYNVGFFDKNELYKWDPNK